MSLAHAAPALLALLAAAPGLRAEPSPVDEALRAQNLATTYLQRVPSVSDGTKLRLIREAERELERCVQLCEQALARDPAAPGAGTLLTSCRSLRATLAGSPSAPAAVPTVAPAPVAAPVLAGSAPTAAGTLAVSPPTTPLARLEVAAAQFTRASAALDEGMARMKSKDLYASLQADVLLASAEAELGQVAAVFDEVLGADPALKLQALSDGPNKVKAGLMQSSTGIRLERATQKRAQLKLRLGKEQAMWQAALAKALKGGRLEVYSARGAPQDFDGNAPGLTPAQQLQEIPRAALWRYTRPGCTVEVRFDGDVVRDTRSQPPGC